MKTRVLVAYGSRYGATAEIAACIGDTIAGWGAEAFVCPVDEAPPAQFFDAAIVGGAARFGRLLPEVVAYVRSNAAPLSSLPTAYFFSGMTLMLDTAENRRQAASYLKPLIEVREPASVGLFGGRIDYDRLPRLLGVALAHDKSHTLPEGDYRAWPRIRGWATGLGAKMRLERS